MRSNKLNVWFILLGVGLLFVVFYYFLGKKFGIREGATIDDTISDGDANKGAVASVTKSGKKKTKGKNGKNGKKGQTYIPDLLPPTSVEDISKINSSRGVPALEPSRTIRFQPSFEPSIRLNQPTFEPSDNIKNSFGGLVDMVYKNDKRLLSLEKFDEELQNDIADELEQY